MTQIPPPPPPPAAEPHGATPAHDATLPSDVRTWAALTHLSAFLGAWVFLAFSGPLVLWLLKRDEHAYLAAQGREAVNFNLTVLVAGVATAIVAVPVAVLTLGLGLLVLIPLVLGIALWWLVLTILAAVAASEGRDYRYPATIRFVR